MLKAQQNKASPSGGSNSNRPRLESYESYNASTGAGMPQNGNESSVEDAQEIIN